MSKVASIGECMIELRPAGNGLYARGFGGDTLNTAVYLARLGVATDYVTALGDDGLSEEMIAGWQAEGVGTTRVLRLKGKLPGIYLIETDARGERRFYHWRESAAARQLMDVPQTSATLQSLASYKAVYLSAITLSIFAPEGRAELFGALRQARGQGALIVFDTNFRARGWPDLAIARATFQEAFTVSDMVLASVEDLLPLYPDETDEQLLQRIACNEVVLKLLHPGSLVRAQGVLDEVAADPVTRPVVDTTAAGDSFAAAYLAARLKGASPVEAARAGHRLAGCVVCYPGAIIPREAMPALPEGAP